MRNRTVRISQRSCRFVDNVVIAFFRYSDFAFFEFGRAGEYRHVIARKHVCAVCVKDIFVDDVLTVEKTFQGKFDRHVFARDAAVLFKGDCRAEAQSDVFAVGKFKRSAVCDFVCALEHCVDKCVHRGACLVAGASAAAGSATAARSAALVFAAASFIAGSQNADAQNENANYCEYSQKFLFFIFRLLSRFKLYTHANVRISLHHIFYYLLIFLSRLSRDFRPTRAVSGL